MKQINYVAKALKSETEFILLLDKATEKFYNAVEMETLYEDKNRKITAYRDNTMVYVFDKKDKAIEVSAEKIYSFNQNNDIKEILYWNHRYPNGVIKDDLNLNLLFTAVMDRKIKINKDIKITEEEFEQKILSGSKTDESKNTVIKFFEYAKEKWGNNFLSNHDFFNFLDKDIIISCSHDAGELRDYSKLLNDKGLMSKVYDESFFLNLSKDSFATIQKYLPQWKITFEALFKACDEHKFTSCQDAYEFNDLDNHVWVQNNKLILTSQNAGFYCDFKDMENYTVYFLRTEHVSTQEEINRIEKSLRIGFIDKIKDIALEVKNDQVAHVNYSLMYCFQLDLQYSGRSMEEAGLLKRNYPVDLTSYQYQKDYYYTKYGISEFNFIVQAMMTLGGGFDYDAKKGVFVDSSVDYLINIKPSPDLRHLKIDSFSYLYPKSISYLNGDWLNALKYVVEVFKRDMPLPVVFNEKTEKESLEKAILYYEAKINSLEKNGLKRGIK